MAIIEPELITEIAKQLSVPATKVFETIVQAQPTLGIINLVGLGFLTIGTAIGAKTIWNYAKKNIEYESDRIPAILVGSAILIGILVVIVAVLSNSATQIMLPEYAALKEIAYMLQ